MRRKWALNVEGFGKIESAKIQVKDLMMFVGDNNSGKSHIMTLLWGILTLGETLFTRQVPTTESYKKCVQWLEDSKSQTEVLIDSEVQQLFLDWYNDVLMEGKEKLVERIFNFPISIEMLRISNFECQDQIVARWTDDIFIGYIEDEEKFEIELPSQLNLYTIAKNLCTDIILAGMRDHNSSIFAKPVFLPASRTGFMLSYKTLLSNTIDPFNGTMDGIRSENNQSRFPMPVTRFLRMLIEMDLEDREKSRFSKVATYIEQGILNGTVTKDNSPMPNYHFVPTGDDKQLPLHVTSSLVAELSPIILSLQSNMKYGLMIIEEPEAHLHLAMQKKITNALIRLVNEDLPVWITTHSDTVLQQVNNMIKLYHNSDRQALLSEHGYLEEDLLDPAKACAYQFTVQENGKTHIEALELTEYGFVVPTLNNAIAKQTEETFAFQELDDDVD